MPEKQEIKTLIETNKEVSVNKESRTPDSFSSIQNNPLFQTQINTYKTQNPEIEKNITDYLQKDPEKTKKIDMQLNNTALDDTKKTKIINTIIDLSLKEVQVFPNTEISKNGKEPQINIEETKREKIIINKEKIVTNEEKIVTNEISESLKQRFQEVELARKTLITNHPQLDIKPESNTYKQTAEKLETSRTIKLLKSKGLSQENITNFITFKATEEVIKSDPTIQDSDGFFLSFKKLENELNIPDVTREDFSSKNITETSKQLFDSELGNQNLITTLADQKQAHAQDYQKLFEKSEKSGEINQTYIKFLAEGDQEDYAKINEKIQNKTPLTQEENKFLNRFKVELSAKKTEFENKTSDSMEQAAILGPIMGLADYMDMNIGNSFDFNKSNDIKIENKMLSIRGNIENRPFSLITNLAKSSKLETSDYLQKKDKSNFSLDENNKQETPYILPGNQEIRKEIKDDFKKSHDNILKNVESIDEYQKILKSKLCEKVKSLYGYKDLVQIRMEKQMTKNIAAQETMDTLNSTLFNGDYEYGKNISETQNGQLFTFLKDLDYSLENLSSKEIEERKEGMKEFKKIIKDVKNNKRDTIKLPILQEISTTTVENTKDIITKQGNKEPNFFTLFEYTKNSKTKIFRTKEFFALFKENKNAKPNEKTFIYTLEARKTKNAEDILDTDLRN